VKGEGATNRSVPLGAVVNGHITFSRFSSAASLSLLLLLLLLSLPLSHSLLAARFVIPPLSRSRLELAGESRRDSGAVEKRIRTEAFGLTTLLL
jgi:hypothetical protein